jgi:hypothetical protein
MLNVRPDIELPESTDKWGWKYHHLGIPTNTEPNSPSDGVRVAMIEHNGAPIELIEFVKNK